MTHPLLKYCNDLRAKSNPQPPYKAQKWSDPQWAVACVNKSGGFVCSTVQGSDQENAQFLAAAANTNEAFCAALDLALTALRKSGDNETVSGIYRILSQVEV